MEKEISSSKEIEKPFRCNACAWSFTNEDHLQVHKRRHEMSLNLSKLNVGGLTSSEGFSDETPTPTRFLRNCEEVGLFQDLQNVNPFDEQFAKASSTTPSSAEAGFDFSSSFRHTNSNANAKEISTNETTLNTPQVFAFQPTTPLIIHTGQKSQSVEENPYHSESKAENTSLSNELNNKGEKSALDLSCRVTEIKVSKSPRSALSLSAKNRANLRLNLSPSIGEIADQKLNNSAEPLSSTDLNNGHSSEDGNESEKKAFLLERNRAAASRSRHRRKQYISALEIKCTTLQEKLNHVQSELIKSRAENALLQQKLSMHSHCNVSNKSFTPKSAPIVRNTIIVSANESSTFHPSILRHGTPKTHVNVVAAHDPTRSSSLSINPKAIATKPKRGRPRRGFEKRVSDLFFLPIPNTTSDSEPPRKIQILPISQFKKAQTSVTNANILKS